MRNRNRNFFVSASHPDFLVRVLVLGETVLVLESDPTKRFRATLQVDLIITTECTERTE